MRHTHDIYYIENREITEQAIAHDLHICDMGLALTRGKARRKYTVQRKICLKAIADMNKADGLANLTDDELLAELMKD
jgi:hypothetical protein